MTRARHLRVVRSAPSPDGREADPLAFQMTGASHRPHTCAVLAIDPGATSGWAVLWSHPGMGSSEIVLAGRGTARGVARTASDRYDAVEVALGWATLINVPLIVAGEKWSNKGRFGGARVQRGLGGAFGRWQEQLELAGIPKRRIVRVKPETWRGAVLGMRTGGRSRVTGDDCRAAALTYVKRRFGIDAGPDEAEAICIGVYAMHCDATSRLLPKGRGR